ncbi:MAG: S1/P1 nuclease, partial [Bradyrhizobium sp.]
MHRFVLAAALLLAACNAAFAWGSSGHSLVGEIAQRHLDPAAQKSVAELLGPGTSLASIASWADDERSRDPTTTRWHFVSI